MLGAIMEIGKLDIVFNPVSTLQKASIISTGREQANVIQWMRTEARYWKPTWF